MLTKFWCWLFGHKFWDKASLPIKTGNRNPITGEEGYFYHWEKQPFCLRCGHELHEVVPTQRSE